MSQTKPASRVSSSIAASSAPPAPAGRRRARIGRWASAIVGVMLAATAGVGVLHTSWGRPLLARLGGCPAHRITPARAEAIRQYGWAQLRGAEAAPSRPALGFGLGQTSEQSVRTWASALDLRCTPHTLGLRSLQCADVPESALPGAMLRAAARPAAAVVSDPIQQLLFTFAVDGKLMSVEALHSRLGGAEASAVFDGADRALARAVGAARDRAGASDASSLTAHPLATAIVRYRFSDYLAIVSVTNLPDRGLTVREQYQAN